MATTASRRGDDTREAILGAAERLFAERGIGEVSNRQIAESAGQGNNTVVSYHFGSKAELIREIVRRHQRDVERRRRRMVAALPEGAGLREWMVCMVHPTAEHLAERRSPTWFARLSAQLVADPRLRVLMEQDPQEAPSLHEVLARLDAFRPRDMPHVVRRERDEILRQLVVHHYAQRERHVAAGEAPARPTWPETAEGLVDVVTAMWSAPWSES